MGILSKLFCGCDAPYSYILRIGTSLSSDEVLGFLHNKMCLHDYLMPAAVIVLKLSEVTLTEDGYLNPNSLPQPDLQQDFVAPRTPTEKVTPPHPTPIDAVILQFTTAYIRYQTTSTTSGIGS